MYVYNFLKRKLSLMIFLL